MHPSTSTASPPFERVYREHFEFVWRTLRALGVVDNAIDDAVQDVFVVVHRRLSGFEGRASIRTWFYEIARRVAMRYRTRAARDAARHAELDELPSRQDMEGAIDYAMAAKVMHEFLTGLDEDRRRAFVLSEFGDMPGREIAETLDLNMNTVYARIRSARTELDRVAKRLHAHDAGAVRRALAADRPGPTTRRRTWAGVAAALTPVSAGHVAPSLGLGAIAWLAGGIGLASVAVVWVAGPSSTPDLPARVDATSVQQANVGDARLSSLWRNPARGMAPEAKGPSQAASAPSPPPLASSTSKAPRPSPPPSRRRIPTAKPAAQPSLAAELRHVRGVRDAVGKHLYEDATTRIAEYRTRFTHGSLREEIEGLELEVGCRSHVPGARQRVDAFLDTHPGSALRTRLETACDERIAPQKPSTGRTQPQ